MKKVVKQNPICVFWYALTDDSSVILTNGAGVRFTDQQLITIADYVEEHGGPDNVKVSELPKSVFRLIVRRCREECVKDMNAREEEPDGEYAIMLDDELPLELKLACNTINASNKR